MAQASAAAPAAGHQQNRFLTNVLWSWTGVAASFFQGIIIPPFVLRKLGTEHYGIWMTIFSILEYFWFFDLGLQSAITNFCARFLALRDPRKLNEVISTAFFYFSIIGLTIMCLSPLLGHWAPGFYKILPQDRDEFTRLVTMTGVSWGLCIMLHMFLSALDGFQRFDLTSRIAVLQVVLRSIGYFVVLSLNQGHVLIRMAWIHIGTQLLGYVLYFFLFRHAFPELRLAPDSVKWSMFREIFRYGIKSFVASNSTLVLQQSGTQAVGRYLGQTMVGFYGLPMKLLQQSIDAVSRVGMITRSSAAELTAMGRRESVISLGVYSNRYSLTLFTPLACFLLVYGYPLIARYMNPTVASYSAPILPVFLLSYGLVLAGQFNSSSLLFGVNAHGKYARALVVEAALYVPALVYVVPRYGILGAAWTGAVLMIAVRGIYTPWLVARALDTSFIDYMRGIYVRPLLTGIPVVALAWLMQTTVLPGRTLPELIAAGAICAAVYFAIATFACIEPHHRALFFSRIPVLGPRLVPNRA
jgi:O-antigen/teichoic acid export membrane protein